MTVQNSLLFTTLLPEILHYTLFSFLKPNETVSFADTCKKALQVISDLWLKKGITPEELKYCLSSSIYAKTTFPLVNKLTSQLPYLLSSRGLSYKTIDLNDDGTENHIFKNIKCVFNSTTLELLFWFHSTQGFFEVTSITPSSDIGSTDYIIKIIDYFFFKNEIFKFSDKIIPREDCESRLYYILDQLKLIKATPLQNISSLELSKPSLSGLEIPIFERFEKESSINQIFFTRDSK